MLLYFLSITLVAFLLTGLIRYYALKRKVLDIPNQRSSHTIPTPRGGGLAIVLTMMFAVLSLTLTQQIDQRILALCMASILVAGIGFCDDHKPVPAKWRFLTHLVTAFLIVRLLGGFPLLLVPSPMDGFLKRFFIDLSWIGYPLAIVWLVWFLNLFNFMDGTDGIAASESLFMSLALAGYSYYLDQTLFNLCICLAAATLGFLVWNWPKAGIFMGDVGSGFLGLLLGVLILLAAQQAAVMLFCGLILFGIFFVDASYTLLVRMLSRQKWYDAHCSHTYQRAAKQYGHLPVLLACWLINLLWLLPLSYWVFLHPSHGLVGLFIAYAPLLFMAFRFKAGQRDSVNV
ncbi:MAG: glycosyl transferase [Methylomonas sp.]|nr:MAG: glycosyl transferase [Methylomonas sp.]